MNDQILSQLPNIDELLSTVSNLQNTICDEECRKNRENVVNYNKYQTSLENARTSIDQAKKAKKNFLIGSRGYTEYTEIQKDQAERDASYVVQQLDNDFDDLYTSIQTREATIAVQSKSINQLRDVSDIYTSRIHTLDDVYNNTQNNKNIHLREASMSEQRIETIHQWVGWMHNLYWFLVVLYAAIIFVIGQGFRTQRSWITLVGLIVFPYIIPWVMDRIPMDWWFSFSIYKY